MGSTVFVIVGVVVAVAVGSLVMLALEVRQRRREELVVQLLGIFGPAIAQARRDPRDLTAWSEVAEAARKLFPEVFQQLDSVSGDKFPFSSALVEAAHARWTADWLAWERQHDLENKQRVSAVEAELDRGAERDVSLLRERLDAIEQEKLQTYQQHYEDYVRVGKAIAELDNSV